jgi:hypothetical protein
LAREWRESARKSFVWLWHDGRVGYGRFGQEVDQCASTAQMRYRIVRKWPSPKANVTLQITSSVLYSFCVISFFFSFSSLIPKGDRLIIELYSTGCKDSSNEINYLEHVQAVISIQSNTRGTLVVHLRSPMGTNSTLLDKRILDQSTESFNKWPFTSVHMWGEKPQGIWTVEIKNNARNSKIFLFSFFKLKEII